MWARRCGAPPGWPSRVKVIFFSFFSGTIGLSIYVYMAGSNISYLDLASPASPDVICLTEWPSRSHAISWSRPREWRYYFNLQTPDVKRIAQQKQCFVTGVSGTHCRRSSIPVDQMGRSLAVAMSGSSAEAYDMLGLWARFFLLLTCAIWLGVTTHDLALVGRHNKHFVLDVRGVNAHCPSIRKVWRSLAGYRPLLRLVAQERFCLRVIGILIAVVSAPIMLAWNLVLFNFVIVPLLLLAFVRYPIRMSRAWVFVACCACCIYGLGLTIQQLIFVADESLRPRYAVTWQPMSVEGDVIRLHECTCGCDYHVSFSFCANLCIIGCLTVIKSFFLGFRCLKGLRRSQWANLLSVLFPVPLTVYSVDWQLPNGQPIKFRTEGVPVQAEVAFDPFAMMDEQLNSHITTLHLRPEPVNRYEVTATGTWKAVPPPRTIEGPSAPIPACFAGEKIYERDTEYIGCCGFPWPTGGRQCVFEPEQIERCERGELQLLAEVDDDSAQPSPYSSHRRRLTPPEEGSSREDDALMESRERTLGSITVSIEASELESATKASTRPTVTTCSSITPCVVGVPHAGASSLTLSSSPLQPPAGQDPPLFVDFDSAGTSTPKKRARKSSESAVDVMPRKAPQAPQRRSAPPTALGQCLPKAPS
mmetsp:Transcript_22538/g.64902  ORF Transcript_22538/g.64902 Transcript_22538/m.64902 type:complete len:646 (+) Transcript_22538:119-2056(+)